MLVTSRILIAALSLIAFGGANAIVPELHRQVVDVMGAMSDASSQPVRPGADRARPQRHDPEPGRLAARRRGRLGGGDAGDRVAEFGSGARGRALACESGRSRGQAAKAGLVPLAVGLMLASGFVLARAADRDVLTVVITGVRPRSASRASTRSG